MYVCIYIYIYIYSARKHGFLNEVSNIKNLEKRVATKNWNECERFRKKWHRIKNELP